MGFCTFGTEFSFFLMFKCPDFFDKNQATAKQQVTQKITKN